MSIQLSGKAPPPRIIGEEDYRKCMALDWKTSHTTRLREAMGDDLLCVAYDPNPARENGPCWLIARLVNTQVQLAYGSGTYTEIRLVPTIIDEWRNTDGTARSIDDPRLYGMLQKADLTNGRFKSFGKDIDQLKLESHKAIRDIAQQESLRKSFAKLADKIGGSRHRKLGTEGGKISTTSIWRDGAGAKPKPLLYTATGQVAR